MRLSTWPLLFSQVFILLFCSYNNNLIIEMPQSKTHGMSESLQEGESIRSRITFLLEDVFGHECVLLT